MKLKTVWRALHLPRSWRKRLERALAWGHAHLFAGVVAFLICCWLGLSYCVYRVEQGAPHANITSYSDGLWWGIVSFLTVGYGDRYPVTPEGRFLATFLMLAGVLAIGILTAKISSFFFEQALRRGRGIVDKESLKNHIIVCGWKEDMLGLFTHIRDFTGARPDELVMIANIRENEVQLLQSHPKLRGLHVIVGDYFQEVYLRRAAPERARKILIIADRSPGPNGQIPSASEVDARTVMTAMTLSKIAPGTLVAAEVLDPKMEQYLKMAEVSEIIFAREYNRLLLANASGGTGFSNIIFGLLDPSTPVMLTTEEIPDAVVGRTYAEFRAAFRSTRKRASIIGILENTGNSHRIKEMALRQAQRTPDVKRLVENLRSVKQLVCNHPVFTPPDDYVIGSGSMAIVIVNREEDHDSETANAA